MAVFNTVGNGVELTEDTKNRYGVSEGGVKETINETFEKNVQILTATVELADWSEEVNELGWFTNQVTVEGMKEAYNPLLDLMITSSALAESERGAFGVIMEAETFDGYVVFKALELPEIDFNVRFVGV